jgi:Family of unknown function (DUF6463)
MEKISGFALIVIGLLHVLVALAIPGTVGFSGIWQDIIKAGVIDAAKPDAPHIWGYYWFVASGLLTIVYGCLCYWIENQLKQSLPSFAGWSLLILSALGIVLDIDTGFWLVLLVAINEIVASWRKQPVQPNVRQ